MTESRTKSPVVLTAALAGSAFGRFSSSGPDAYATPMRPAGVAAATLTA